MKKSVFVGIFLVVLVGMLTVLFRLQVANTDASTLSISARLTQAEGFLERLYNPSMGLCRETLVGDYPHEIAASNRTSYARLTNETYWIASDNFLDSLALKPYNLTLSENISQTCSIYYNGSYFPYQIMQGGNISLTLHTPNTYVLENTSDHVIALNLYNGTIDNTTYLDYPTCGDALVYEALNYYVQGYPLDWCNNLYMEAYNMFDGKGVADSAFYNSNSTPSARVYANMKLALLVFGARVLNLSVSLTGIEQQLWSAQNMNGTEMGGITSLMNSSGQRVGTANGETTALTLLAYDNTTISKIHTEGEQARANSPKNSISIAFPATNFNQTTSITTNLTAIPLLSNWTVTSNNTVQWSPSLNNPRAAEGFYSSLADPGNLSIQLIEYSDGFLDIIAHDANHTKGYTLETINWSNPLTISLISDTLKVSSPAGTYVTSFPSFRLAYITAGSTLLIANPEESGICTGGEVDKTVSEFSANLILPLFMIPTLLAVIGYKKRQSVKAKNNARYFAVTI